MFHHLLALEELSFFRSVFWSWAWPRTMRDQHKCMQLAGDVEWMRCHVERGYGNLTPCGSTLWVRVKSDMPFITVVYNLMRRRLVENILLVVRRICALWPICVTIFYSSSDSTFYDILRCHYSMLAWIVVYWSVLHLILDSIWIWYSLWLELKIPTLVWHWDSLLCFGYCAAYSLQVMRTSS